MRFLLALIAAAVLLCPHAASAQTPPSAEAPEVMRARLALERLRALVQAGAMPRAELERAEDALADAQDLAVLRRTISATDLTEEQSDEMVAAARHRLDRRQKQLDKARGLLDAGLIARAEMDTYSQEVDFAQRQYDLAVQRAELCREMAAMARLEQQQMLHPEQSAGADHPVSERFEGNGIFTPDEFHQVSAAFERRFHKPLPVSAFGQTAVHSALGFDHRNRVDVALNPDQPEGIWLRHYLELRRIPYFAFRQAVPGKATGAHIHMGPMSTRLALNSRPAASGAALQAGF
jgi:hypothetical protein